jgi:hypothetical protein
MDFDIVQILHLSAIDIQDKPLHRTHWTLRSTDRNNDGHKDTQGGETVLSQAQEDV